jgi:DNA repair exonuclease SbcCD nuclease subunit
MILFFSDLHINETAQFSVATETGFSVRQLEGIQACQDVVDLLQDPNYKFEAVVFGGDLINKVGNNISASDLAAVTKCITMIQEECIKQGITFYILVGNHDIGANMLGFHKLIPFKCYPNVKIVDSFEVDGDYVFMPYVFDDSAADIFLNSIQDKQNKVVFSHLELKDVPLGNGLLTTRGASINLLKEFKMTLQGHYHTPQSLESNIIVSGSTQKTSFKDPGGGTMILYDPETNKITRKNFSVPSWYTFDDDNIEDIKSLDADNYVKLVISSENILKMHSISKDFLSKFKGSEIAIDVQKISLKRNKNMEEEMNQETEEEILHKFIELSKIPEEDKQAITEIGLNLITRARK